MWGQLRTGRASWRWWPGFHSTDHGTSPGPGQIVASRTDGTRWFLISGVSLDQAPQFPEHIVLSASGRMKCVCIWGLIREGFLRRSMTPDRGVLIPWFRQKAHSVTLPLAPPCQTTLVLGLCMAAFVLPLQPWQSGVGEALGPPSGTLFRGHVTSRPHGNHATCHSCWSPQRQPESSSCSLGCH